MITYSANDTVQAGEELAKTLKIGDAVLLFGEMGAGKTHFVKGLAKGLNITANITSPTFALINEYEYEAPETSPSYLKSKTKQTCLHCDLFRIASEDDLYSIGFYDYLGKGIIAVEWSENVPELEEELRDFGSVYKVIIEKTGENERKISIIC